LKDIFKDILRTTNIIVLLREGALYGAPKGTCKYIISCAHYLLSRAHDLIIYFACPFRGSVGMKDNF